MNGYNLKLTNRFYSFHLRNYMWTRRGPRRLRTHKHWNKQRWTHLSEALISHTVKVGYKTFL